MPRIAILAASRRELAPVYAALEPLERRRSISIERRPGLYEVRQAGEVEVYLLKTGMGPRAAADAARALLADVTVDAVVSTGYAGALGSAGIGEVILGTDVSAWTKDMSDWTQGPDRAIFRVAPDLLAMARDAAKEAALAWSEGSVDTVDRVLWRADEKRALADASGAIAVDMESAAIARVALDKQAPFLLVRAVSDRADETLPMDFNLWLTPGERLRAMAQLVGRPAMVSALLQMKRQADQASHSLTRFFQAWWRLLGQASAPDRVPVSAAMGACRR